MTITMTTESTDFDVAARRAELLTLEYVGNDPAVADFLIASDMVALGEESIADILSMAKSRSEGHAATVSAALDSMLSLLESGKTQRFVAEVLSAHHKAGNAVLGDARNAASVGYLESVARFARLSGDMPDGWVLMDSLAGDVLGAESVQTLVRGLTDMTDLARGYTLPEGVTAAAVLDKAGIPRKKGVAITAILDEAADKADALAAWTALRDLQHGAIKKVAGGGKGRNKSKTPAPLGKRIASATATVEAMTEWIKADDFAQGSDAHAAMAKFATAFAALQTAVAALPADAPVAA
jgi:hypothetical protein